MVLLHELISLYTTITTYNRKIKSHFKNSRGYDFAEASQKNIHFKSVVKTDHTHKKTAVGMFL